MRLQRFLLSFIGAMVIPGMLFAEAGALYIFVKDDAGNPTANAPIYITQGSRVQVVQSDERGTAVVNLKEGIYVVSASVNRPAGDWVDRFASPLAKVRVYPLDTSSVILNMQPVEDPVSSISLATLEKMGIAKEVAKYTN